MYQILQQLYLLCLLKVVYWVYEILQSEFAMPLKRGVLGVPDSGALINDYFFRVLN